MHVSCVLLLLLLCWRQVSLLSVSVLCGLATARFSVTLSGSHLLDDSAATLFTDVSIVVTSFVLPVGAVLAAALPQLRSRFAACGRAVGNCCRRRWRQDARDVDSPSSCEAAGEPPTVGPPSESTRTCEGSSSSSAERFSRPSLTTTSCVRPVGEDARPDSSGVSTMSAANS